MDRMVLIPLFLLFDLDLYIAKQNSVTIRLKPNVGAIVKTIIPKKGKKGKKVK